MKFKIYYRKRDGDLSKIYRNEHNICFLICLENNKFYWQTASLFTRDEFLTKYENAIFVNDKCVTNEIVNFCDAKIAKLNDDLQKEIEKVRGENKIKLQEIADRYNVKKDDFIYIVSGQKENDLKIGKSLCSDDNIANSFYGSIQNKYIFVKPEDLI